MSISEFGGTKRPNFQFDLLVLKSASFASAIFLAICFQFDLLVLKFQENRETALEAKTFNLTFWY